MKSECFARIFSDRGIKLLAQQGAGTVQAHFHVLFCRLEHLCGLGGAQFLDFAQHVDHAVIVRQALDCLLQQGAGLAIGG